MKELKISAIKQGTVIDHVPAKSVFDVVDILKLQKHDNILSIATNLPSKKHKLKGIVKIADRDLTNKEFDKISLVAPEATISIIKEYKVQDKKSVSMPDKFINIIKCPNPKCVSNKEKTERTFYLVNKDPLNLRCRYCERTINGDKVELI